MNRKTRTDVADESDQAATDTQLSRRSLLKGLGGSPLLAAGAAAATSIVGTGEVRAEVIAPLNKNLRNVNSLNLRIQAITSQFYSGQVATQPTNADESYPDKRASFYKTLPHDSLGEVSTTAYAALRNAFITGDPAAFAAIPRDPSAQSKLANPQAALAYTLTGLDPHATRIRTPPAFDSAEAAAEMAEVYWQAMTREIPFRQYASSSTIGSALPDLNALSATVGPKISGDVTVGTLFRGETPGDLVGPFISQLLLQPIPFGATVVEQRYRFPTAVNFMTTYASWLSNQKGVAPTTPLSFDAVPRYIHNGRSLCEYVHVDFSYQPYLSAALIILARYGNPVNPNNPYPATANQVGALTLGGPDVIDMVAKAANLGLRASWFQKWCVHRRLRPEAYGGRLHNQMTGAKNYGLPSELANTSVVSQLMSANGTAMLPMAFPEGSPTHPSYPAGHAAIAGACCTVLKGFFNEAFVLPSAVEANDDGTALLPWTGGALTLGGEINKLAANISLGRDTAGVHYRSDGIEGLDLGEQIGMSLLRDESRFYNEDFGGFQFTRFNGQKVLIVDGQIINI
jgi:PAP2 superfamily